MEGTESHQDTTMLNSDDAVSETVCGSQREETEADVLRKLKELEPGSSFLASLEPRMWGGTGLGKAFWRNPCCLWLLPMLGTHKNR